VSTDTLGPLRPSAKDTRPHAADSVPLVAENALAGACAAQFRKYSVYEMPTATATPRAASPARAGRLLSRTRRAVRGPRTMTVLGSKAPCGR